MQHFQPAVKIRLSVKKSFHCVHSKRRQILRSDHLKGVDAFPLMAALTVLRMEIWGFINAMIIVSIATDDYEGLAQHNICMNTIKDFKISRFHYAFIYFFKTTAGRSSGLG